MTPSTSLRTGLVLASQSQSRREMLDAAGVAHEVHPADLDEAAIKREMEGRPPPEIALALAEAKARWVSREIPQALVLGSDSMIAVDGERYSKPVSRADAAAHLRAFSGQTLHLWSAAALARDGDIVDSHCDEARLAVRTLSEDFIASYLDAEWPAIAGCVGCFRIEGQGVQLFEKLEGSHFTILGMPLLWVLAALRRAGHMAS